MQVLSALTMSIVPTFERCSPEFSYGPTPAAPARVLTKPSEPAVPGGHDNVNDDLIVSVDDVLVTALGTK